MLTNQLPKVSMAVEAFHIFRGMHQKVPGLHNCKALRIHSTVLWNLTQEQASVPYVWLKIQFKK